MKKQDSEQQSQLDKFKELARTVETDDNEAAFDRALKKVAKAAKDKSPNSATTPKDDD